MDTDQKTWKVKHLAHDSGKARHLLVSKVTHRVSVALGVYESHLVSGNKPPNTRRNRLMDCSYLYSWADEVGIDVDQRLLSGAGFEVREIRRFAHWLKYEYIGKEDEALSSGTIGTILNSCARVSAYMYEQYLEVDDTTDRAAALLTLLANDKANWSSVVPPSEDDSEAPDLTDEEMARIDAAIHPELRRSVSVAASIRDYLMWRLTSRLGMRIGEVLALRLCDCPARPGDPLRIVRIEDRGKAYRDSRTPYAPRPKTKTRDLNLAEDPELPGLLLQYLATRQSVVKTDISDGPRAEVPDHGFLIVNHVTGQPLSSSGAQRVAEQIAISSQVDFHWHVGRHAYFNRQFALIADAPNYGALRDVLQYKGGWGNPKSLNIYTRRVVRERALGTLATYQSRLDRMGQADSGIEDG